MRVFIVQRIHPTMAGAATEMALDEKEADKQYREHDNPQPSVTAGEILRLKQPDDKTLTTEIEHDGV